MVENGVHRVAHILQGIRLGGFAGWNDHAARQAFRLEVVALGIHHHRAGEVLVGPAAAGPAVRRSEVEAGENAGELGDVAIVVGRNWLAVSIQLAAAVRVEFPQADGEELQVFPGVVFVRIAGDRRIGLLVSGVAQIPAHRGMECHFPQQIAVIPQRVAGQRVVVIRHRLGLLLEVRVAPGNDEDLREREGHALAELVLAADRVAGEGRGDVVTVDEAVLLVPIIGRVDPRAGAVGLDFPDVRLEQ